MNIKLKLLALVLIVLLLAACNMTTSNSSAISGSETGRVVRVIDGDTIDVEVNGNRVRVRYVGVNTPESDEPCFNEATAANAAMVENQIVVMQRDNSDTDRYDRLLRYIYVGDTFVNSQLVANGYAEAVLYEPDDRFYNDFLALEQQATDSNLGCHPTGIFNDGSTRR